MRAQQPVAIELVLALDVSSSVNDAEYDLQRGGLAAALMHRDVIALIENHENGIAVAVVQWSSWASASPADNPWRHLTDAASVRAFAAEVRNMPRVNAGHLTNIAGAMTFSLDLIEANGFTGLFRKVDISGDGQHNVGGPLVLARARATADNVSVSGLAITTDVPNLDHYYQSTVIAGPGAFVVRANDYSDFAQAMTRKLLRELSAMISDAPSGKRKAEAQRFRQEADLVGTGLNLDHR